MKPLVFVENENGKIEFTKEQLQQLLDSCYDEGIKDGSKTIVSYPVSIEPWWLRQNYEDITITWSAQTDCSTNDLSSPSRSFTIL